VIFRSYLFVILTCVQILCPLLIMAGSFSSSQDIEAEIFFRASICVRKAKKKSFECGYIGTCRLLSVLKK